VDGFSVVKAEGCGRIDIGQMGRFAGSSFTFDAKTKQLIGVYSYTDELSSNCKENTRVYGKSLFPPLEGTLLAPTRFELGVRRPPEVSISRDQRSAGISEADSS
jgi:hypothetical protein